MSLPESAPVNRNPVDPERPAWQLALLALRMPLFLGALCLLALTRFGFLVFHTMAEGISIIISITALVVASTSLRFTRNHFAVFIAIAIGWCAALDFVHLMVYKGMNLLPVDNGASTQYWIAARYIQAVGLLLAPLALRRPVKIRWLHLGFGGAVTAAALSISTGHFPVTYIEGSGLTMFKALSEYVIIGMMAVALLLYRENRGLMSDRLYLGMSAAVGLMILAELCFSSYMDLYGLGNRIGHLLKIVAYWYVYLALVRSTLSEPFTMLARAASTYDAVPDPALVITKTGRIVQANDAAAVRTGIPAEMLAGRFIHDLFHDPAVSGAMCPVCRRLTAGGGAFEQDLELDGGKRTVTCIVAPFGSLQKDTFYVEVVRDITERVRMLKEREGLIHDMGERIKELRCLSAVSALSESPGLDIRALLEGVVALLPPAFEHTAHARAAIDSAWGRFGAPADPHARLHLERHIRVDGEARGKLSVWYSPELPDTVTHFLTEEEALLDNIARQTGDSIARLRDAEKVKRLSYLYEMLSATNRALVYSRSTEELLAGVFSALVANTTFPILIIAVTDSGNMPLRITHRQGVPPEHVQKIADILADPQSQFGKALPGFRSGNVMNFPVIPLDGNTDDPHAAWYRWIQTQGITERVAVPLRRGDALMGVILIYATHSLSSFDDDQMRLLNEMAVDIAFGLGTLQLDEQRRAAEAQADFSEHRFREVFESSPLPMQIHSLSTRRVRAINRAHQEWLGFAPEDIPDEESWMRQAYPDPALRERVHAAWVASVEEAQHSGRTVSSPEITLTGKDGQQRIVRGTMTIVGDDMIIAWTDLTEIRQGEQSLIESEHRFRGMIEHNVGGIYVSRDGLFIYVNPSLCELTGWSSEELLGQPTLAFCILDEAGKADILTLRKQLDAGAPNVRTVVAFRCKDGRVIELSIQAKRIDWDDGLPAFIAMVNDITEQKRAQEQITHYVNRLEGSLKATLQAVSTMVELRDPYTAGHERRVGLIAGAIGRELGWSEERCRMLEMTGLVHDIGKIAVPSEILTKPSRLTALEMELVKGHAEAGYQILKDVPFETPVAEIIRQHHERLDGSGYPRGLKGDEILPEARVLAVADVVESMAAHRPYRPAQGMDAALAEIERGRGAHFDPEVVDAVVRMVRETGYTLPG